MNRRRFLAATGVTLSVSIAGCLGAIEAPGNGNPGKRTDGSGDGGDEDTVPVLLDFDVSQRVVPPEGERDSELDSWALFVAARDVAEGYFGDVDERGAEEVRTFVDETDFEAGERLLYVRAFAPQTCYELVLDEEPFVAENGLPNVNLRANRTASDDEVCGEAMTPVAILLRLAFDPDAGPADVVEVRVSGHRDDAEELLVEAER